MNVEARSPEEPSIQPLEPALFPWLDYRRYTYSLGLRVGGASVLSGSTAVEWDPAVARLVARGDLGDQTRTAFAKMRAVLAEAGLGFEDVTRLVEYVSPAGLRAYDASVAVRQELLGLRPLVSRVCVRRLLRPTALIELEAIGIAKDRPSPFDALEYLPSIFPLDETGKVQHLGDLEAQVRLVFKVAVAEARRRGRTGLAQVTVFLTTAAAEGADVVERTRRLLLRPPYPVTSMVLLDTVGLEGALVQLEVVAAREPIIAHGADPHFATSDAVQVGRLLFFSGRVAADVRGNSRGTGDIVAQARVIYEGLVEDVAATKGGPWRLLKTVEFITEIALEHYRETAAIRSSLLAKPFPVATGVVCASVGHPSLELLLDAIAVRI